jgi:hypothetical protein
LAIRTDEAGRDRRFEQLPPKCNSAAWQQNLIMVSPFTPAQNSSKSLVNGIFASRPLRRPVAGSGHTCLQRSERTAAAAGLFTISQACREPFKPALGISEDFPGCWFLGARFSFATRAGQRDFPLAQRSIRRQDGHLPQWTSFRQD